MLSEHIDIKNNRKLAVSLNLWALVLLIPFVIFPVLRVLFWAEEGSVTITFRILPIFLCILGVIAVLILHELVHGIFFKVFSGEKIKYGFSGAFASAGVPGQYFYKKEYLVVGLAPFVLINLLLAGALFSANGGTFIAIYVILAIHFAGCVGDLYIAVKLFNYPEDTLIRDSGMEMEFYKKQ